MSAADGQADDALVARLLGGDEDAFVALVGRYERSLHRVARTFVKDDSLAEDVVQETWIGLLRGIHKFEGRASFKTWLFRVLANRARTRAVREARYVPIDQTDEPSTVDGQFEPDGRWRVPPREWQITPERLLLSDEVRELVDGTLAELPATQRAVVELRDVEGLDGAEVCNILGISETNQRVLLHRGRTKLRVALAGKLESDGERRSGGARSAGR
jgi:RNA polymerase sigma-70 factor (ECF subfamily)